MADPQADADAYTWPFQLTRSMHRDVYWPVSPTNPSLSASGRTVLITGGGGACGGGIAKAWAMANAERIILVGRTLSTLETMASSLYSINASVNVVAKTADTRIEKSIAQLFRTLDEDGIRVDILVDAAGAFCDAISGTITPTEWWNVLESNIKAPYMLMHYMISTYGDSCGTVMVVGSNAAAMVFPGMSAYSCSKLAQIRLIENLQIEHPNMRFFTLSPGCVASQISHPYFLPYAKDTPLLVGGLSLFLCTPRADYMKGGFVSVNWDVDVMEEHREEIEQKQLLKLGFVRAQLGTSGHPFGK